MKRPYHLNPEWQPDWPEPRTRERKPTLRTVLAAAKRAGLPVAAVQVNPDGSIVITPGTPNLVPHKDKVPTANEWH